MPTVVQKLKGTLSIGTTPLAMEMQVTKVGMPLTVTRDSPVTVLTGDLIVAGATYSWSLSGEALLDMSNKTGVFYGVRALQGTTAPFTFVPVGTTAGPTITGTVVVDGWSMEELSSGSNVVSKFNWPIQGPVTFTQQTLLADEEGA